MSTSLRKCNAFRIALYSILFERIGNVYSLIFNKSTKASGSHPRESQIE